MEGTTYLSFQGTGKADINITTGNATASTVEDSSIEFQIWDNIFETIFISSELPENTNSSVVALHSPVLLPHAKALPLKFSLLIPVDGFEASRTLFLCFCLLLVRI